MDKNKTAPRSLPKHIPLCREKIFWLKIEKGLPDQCWPWKGGGSNGYGAFSLMVSDGLYRNFMATRLVLFFTTLLYPLDMQALHTCDNPSCCNPNHLYWGNQKQNIKDAIDRKRYKGYFSQEHIYGDNHPNAKLTSKDVASIRHLHSIGVTNKELVTMFGVNKQNISMIVRGKAWRQDLKIAN